jgi:hypothetical protein
MKLMAIHEARGNSRSQWQSIMSTEPDPFIVRAARLVFGEAKQ